MPTLRTIRPKRPTSDGPPTPGELAPKRRNISQACRECRNAKSKCDGTRPSCQTCRQKGKQCGYEFEDNVSGLSRHQMMRARIEHLQRLVDQQTPDAGLATPEADAPVAASSEAGPDAEDDDATLLSRHPRPLVLHRLPSATLTIKAREGFFSCSGKLFHVFSREQVLEFHATVFGGDDHAVQRTGAMVCRLMSVAAIGAQYMAGTQGNDMEKTFYDLARYNLEELLEEHPLDAIKVLTLLCMYNIMNKATVSLAYVEIGLTLCRRFGLHSKYSLRTGVSNEMWVDYRKAWRTLMFLSSWLSSTLGYISAHDVLFERGDISELEVEASSDIADIVQTEMAKISVLKAQILRMQLAFKNLTAPTVQSIMLKLQNWYNRLPKEMHLLSTSHSHLPVEVKRSIFYVHLLYLGATMLIYRRVVAQSIGSLTGNAEQNVLQPPLGAMLGTMSNESIMAAASSARILNILLHDEGIFKRCWLIIFQTYTSCVILLHSAAQKRMRKMTPPDWENDLENAQFCLDVLAYCGSADAVAARFHDTLGDIYASFKSRDVDEQPGSSVATAFTAAADGALYFATDPNSPDGQLSQSLLMMLARPFGDRDGKKSTELSIKGAWWREDPTRYEYPQLVERLEWDFESSLPFSWDFEKIGERRESYDGGGSGGSNRRGSDDGQLGRNQFLGSLTPSGWAPLPAFQG